VRFNAPQCAGAEKKEAEGDRKQSDGGFRHRSCPFIGRPYLARTRDVPAIPNPTSCPEGAPSRMSTHRREPSSSTYRIKRPLNAGRRPGQARRC
jgi:hypothetical protein